ncbi:hypothetical protein ACFL6S_22750 [Candidatus Poribacteria bacterium]
MNHQKLMAWNGYASISNDSESVCVIADESDESMEIYGTDDGVFGHWRETYHK